MAFCRKVYNIINVIFGKDFSDCLSVANVGLNKAVTRGVFNALKIFKISGISMLIYIEVYYIIILVKHIDIKG